MRHLNLSTQVFIRCCNSSYRIIMGLGFSFGDRIASAGRTNNPQKRSLTLPNTERVPVRIFPRPPRGTGLTPLHGMLHKTLRRLTLRFTGRRRTTSNSKPTLPAAPVQRVVRRDGNVQPGGRTTASRSAAASTSGSGAMAMPLRSADSNSCSTCCSRPASYPEIACHSRANRTSQ